MILPLYILLMTSLISIRSDASPAFPDLFDTNLNDNRRLHILAESVTEDNGYQTTEEFVDFDLGKETYIVTDKSGNSITHVDARADVIFRYRPYSCITLDPRIIEGGERAGLWNTKVSFKPNPEEENGDKEDKDAKNKDFHLFGIVAVWMRAKELPKTYATSTVVYSASKDVYKAAHKWTVEDHESKELISFYFIEGNISTGKKYTLEMLQVETMETKRLVRTLNILSFDNFIHEQVYESLLQVPAGYGCGGLKYYDLNSKKSLENSYIKILLSHSHRIDLEATATKYDTNDNESKRYSDTISIELIRTEFEDYLGENTLQLVRHRDTFQDVKRIFNYHYNVQYDIDLRKGTCQMSNMGKMKKYSPPPTNNNNNNNEITGKDGGVPNEAIFISFNNGLKLNIDLNMMNTIFVDTYGFNYIKRISKNSFKDHIYFEKTFDGNFFEGKPVSLIRTYSISSSKQALSSSSIDANEEFDTNSKNIKQSDEIRLESVTIWVFNEAKTQIIESYHLNIIEALELDNELELAKIFDVSDECYLNNEKMKDGKDFAWFELTYPVASHYGNILSTKTATLKEQLYSLIFRSQLGLFRAPKMELMFIEAGFIVRALVLDLPPIELMFDLTENSSIMYDQKEGETKDKNKNSDLFNEMASDLQHCSDLCKFYKCKTMSFCENNHRCLLSTNVISYASNEDPNNGDNDNYKRKLIANQSCKTYTIPQHDIIDYDKIYELSLHRQLSKLQHQEYRDVVLPKMPYELIAPQSETNVDDETLSKLTREYIDTLYKYMHDHEDEGFPAQIFSANLDGALIILIPNKFELEQDPLVEFDLSDKVASLSDDDYYYNDGSGLIVPTFHEGLSMQHYKLSLLLKRDEGTSTKKARLFNGINYDQCALACIDSRCSSFSYCGQRKECIITDIYDISSTITKSMIEQDLDCFIAQRDFLSKFYKFPSVVRPNIYKKSSDAYNPSECAHSCIIETNFNCLAFDYCESELQNEMATCFYLDTNNNISPEEISAKKVAPPPNGTFNNKKQSTTQALNTKRGCNHYIRSYLADFSRIQYRKIQDDQMLKLKASTYEGRSVDQCADICINELTDCTAFQFCFDPSNSSGDGAIQKCTLIESKPTNSDIDYQIVLNHTTSTDGLSDGGQDEIIKAGKFIIDSDDCHLFSLRRDSTQAHLRDLALNSMTFDEYNDAEKNKNGNGGSNGSGGGLTVGGGFLLYFCLALVSAAIGCGICLAKHRSDYVRKRIERLQMSLGL